MSELQVFAAQKEFLRGIQDLPGNRILYHLYEMEHPQKVIRELSCEDFFWLMKKIGDEDCLQLLQMASQAQWQYLMDMEFWKKDYLDLPAVTLWLSRFQEADCARLVHWLFTEGDFFAHYYLIRNIEVVIANTKDEVYDLPDGFFSLDGIFHLRILDSEHLESMENILRTMAGEDYTRFQSLLLGLAGVLPAELEEELYRQRNVRLAEHGFLPFEEAIGVYAPLSPDHLITDKASIDLETSVMVESKEEVPLLPLYSAPRGNLFMETLDRIPDPLFLDRMRLEFAGLCNQILSADGIRNHELDTLVRVCRRAAGYLNLAMEKLCGRDPAQMERLIKDQPLLSLFRVGFGLALKLKWEAEGWLKTSWFFSQGLTADFWGEEWGGSLKGLLSRLPGFYLKQQGAEEFRDFQTLSEVAESLKTLRRVMVLDGLMERITRVYPMDEELSGSGDLVFYPLLFDLWARHLLDLPPSLSGIPREKAGDLFRKLRKGEKAPPYRMPRWEKAFLTYITSFAQGSNPEAGAILHETLLGIWQDFCREYESITPEDLDNRYSTFLILTDRPTP